MFKDETHCYRLLNWIGYYGTVRFSFGEAILGIMVSGPRTTP